MSQALELRPPALLEAPDPSSEPVSLPAAEPEAAMDVPDDCEPLLSQLPEPSQLQLSQPDSAMCSQLLMSQLVAPAPTVVLEASVAQAFSELATKLLRLGASPSALPTEFDQLVAASDVHPVRAYQLFDHNAHIAELCKQMILVRYVVKSRVIAVCGHRGNSGDVSKH